MCVVTATETKATVIAIEAAKATKLRLQPRRGPGFSALLAPHFVEDVRRATHEEDASGLRAAGHEQLARELERAWGDYAPTVWDYATMIGSLGLFLFLFFLFLRYLPMISITEMRELLPKKQGGGGGHSIMENAP